MRISHPHRVTQLRDLVIHGPWVELPPAAGDSETWQSGSRLWRRFLDEEWGVGAGVPLCAAHLEERIVVVGGTRLLPREGTPLRSAVIPAGHYLEFIVRGGMPDRLAEAWEKVHRYLALAGTPIRTEDPASEWFYPSVPDLMTLRVGVEPQLPSLRGAR